MRCLLSQMLNRRFSSNIVPAQEGLAVAYCSVIPPHLRANDIPYYPQ